MNRNGNATHHVDAPAEVVFARLTDVRGLPDWNRRITRVVEAPPKLEAGAEWVRKPQDHFYGERSGTVRDPFGHEWNVGHAIEDVSPEEMQRRYTALFQKA